MTESTRDTTFTKGALLGLIGALLVILYFIPDALLAMGVALLFIGLLLISVSILRLRRHLEAYPFVES